MSAGTEQLPHHLIALSEAIDDAVIATDRSNRITTWNSAAERLYGYSAATMIGQPITKICPADRLSEEPEILSRVHAGDTVRELHTVHQRSDGTTVPVSLTVQPIFDGHRHIIGAVRIARDASAWERMDRAARRLSAIVESSDDAIVSKDLNGIITSWNRAAERMFGYAAPEVIGRSIRLLIPQDRQSEEDTVLATLRRGDKVDHFETVRLRKDGSLINISLSVSPIRDDRGTVIGASKIARDITDRTRMEAERARLLKVAEDNASVTEKLNHVGAIVASELNREAVVQAVTDAATDVTGAAVGAFFYNVTDKQGEAYTLYTISGASREQFAKFPMPRNTAVFEPTFRGTGIVRSDDITKDPRYGRSGPYFGMPPGHLPVRSYLAAPVKGRTGEVIGGLFFGHGETARFDVRHERIIAGIASWASIALENARLYDNVQEASRLKDEFLATLSHELRTPLNAILGYARMIRGGIVAPERQQRAFETIERNAVSLTQIVEDVLDVSRIIAGKLRLNVQPVDIAAVVRNAVEGVMPAADARGVSVQRVLDPDAGPVSGDPERLQQVVWNLLTNAVKFTNRGGRVQVCVEQVDSHVEIRVSDTGIGISRAFLPHVFERFRQGDSGTTREHGGLGLGLSITRQLVELHGGRIRASSEGEGCGSTFSVELPRMILNADMLGSREHPRTPSARPTLVLPDLRGIRVLVVDDDPDALGMVREILEAAGASVTMASSAANALASLATAVPDALVADLGMPRMDGFALLERVRSNDDPNVRKLPAAALTAYARSEDRARALRSGFQLHLSKPIDPAELMAAITALVAPNRQA